MSAWCLDGGRATRLITYRILSRRYGAPNHFVFLGTLNHGHFIDRSGVSAPVFHRRKMDFREIRLEMLHNGRRNQALQVKAAAG